jgi:hypothetical protein
MFAPAFVRAQDAAAWLGTWGHRAPHQLSQILEFKSDGSYVVYRMDCLRSLEEEGTWLAKGDTVVLVVSFRAEHLKWWDALPRRWVVKGRRLQAVHACGVKGWISLPRSKMRGPEEYRNRVKKKETSGKRSR